MLPQFFIAILVASLLLSGVAWAQVQSDRQGQGQQQPLQPDMVHKDQQPLDLSIDRHRPQAKDKKKVAGVTDIKKNTPNGGDKDRSFGLPTRQYGMSISKSKEPQVGALGSGVMEYNQSGSFGPKSFLDGYFLKSIDEVIARKKFRVEEKPKDEDNRKGKLENDLRQKRKAFD
jgi:hypothetical protein